MVLLTSVVERTEGERSHALHVPDMKILVRGRTDTGERHLIVAPRAPIDDLGGIEVLHPVAARVADVEHERVHLERRRSKYGVLVPNELLDVAHESAPLRRRRRTVVMHHRSVDPAVDREAVDHQRRRDLRRRVDETIVVLESIVRLIDDARVAVDDVPPDRQVDVERHRVGLVIDHVHEERRAVPVGVRGIEHAEGAGECIREHAIVDGDRARAGRIDAPQRPVLTLPSQRNAARPRHR